MLVPSYSTSPKQLIGNLSNDYPAAKAHAYQLSKFQRHVNHLLERCGIFFECGLMNARDADELRRCLSHSLNSEQVKPHQLIMVTLVPFGYSSERENFGFSDPLSLTFGDEFARGQVPE